MSRFLVAALLVSQLVTAGQVAVDGIPVPIDEDIAALVSPEVGLDFVQAFFKSLAVIVVTELGDKTFFIAAVS